MIRYFQIGVLFLGIAVLGLIDASDSTFQYFFIWYAIVSIGYECMQMKEKVTELENKIGKND